MEEDENASNSFTQEQRQLEPRLAVVAGSGTAATAATATATTTTYLKTKARLSNKETVRSTNAFAMYSIFFLPAISFHTFSSV